MARIVSVNISNRKGEKKHSVASAPALARTFTGFVENFGRSFEFGLASRYYLLNKPLSMFKLVPMGMGLFTRGRLHLLPNRIRQMDQLRAIIKKAREIGGAS